MTIDRAAILAVGFAVVVACDSVGRREVIPVVDRSSTSLAERDDECCEGSAERRPQRYIRRWLDYRTPDVTLVDQDGRKVRLRAELDRPEPVVLNFVFTTCRTICPAMTATFSSLDRQPRDAALRMVSISLDPQFDSPSVLKRYRERYGATRKWRFLTGSARDLDMVYRAFHVLEGSKFSHSPFTLIRWPDRDRWLRLDGFVGSADLVAELRREGGADSEASDS